MAARLTSVMVAMSGARPDRLPVYPARILDVNHLPGSEHQLKDLRTIRAGALPDHALIVLDHRLILDIDVILCEGGHAQERSLRDQALGFVAASMRIASPEGDWIVFHDLPPGEPADVLVRLAQSASLPKLRKHPRGSKEPKPRKRTGVKVKRVAIAQVLITRQACMK